MSNEKNSRYIKTNTKLKLYSQAAGQCSMYGCCEELTFDITNGKSLIGNIAHIEALNNNGPRFNPHLSIEERNSEDNLILLCPNCHAKIDADLEKYTVEYLKKMKKDHIQKMKLIKDNSSLNFNYDDLYYASKNIINEQIPLNESDNYTIENYELSEIDYKINKNELTSISKNNIINGLVQQQVIEEFFVDMSKENETFFDMVRNSLKNSYELLKHDYHGDYLFLAIYDNFKKGLTENQQNACLAIIVYFFTICELFEK